MTTQPRIHHLLDRLLRGVLLPGEEEQLATLVRAQEQRLEDWKQAASAGMTLADNLRSEILALAPGVPLVCSDDRHKTQVPAQAIRIRELEAVVARVTRAVDAGPVGSCCAHLIRAALNPPTGPGHDEGAAGT
ncbi:hypothetical protein OG473_39355 (plasmid) [Streptomyces anulatus]|uniref:hypothetical protein n=1 Tax=Streptomyces anulatus TaxID=1892 RepID=UPI00324CD2C2